jgi:hypothetical protein
MIRHPSSRAPRVGILPFSSRDALADAFGRRLDDDWHCFRHVAPGGIEPIDAILVGPGGTWALTTAGERGRYARRNGHWYRWNRGTESWVPWEAAPITAARLAARRLSLYLERAALPSEVNAVLAPSVDMEVQAEPADPIGITVEQLPERLVGPMTAEPVLTQQQVDRIVALLDPRQPLPQLAPSTPRG